MNTVTDPVTPAAPPLAPLKTAIDAACARIAPTWPLDRFIAVNPYWGQLERPIAAAAAHADNLNYRVLKLYVLDFKHCFPLVVYNINSNT